MHKKKLRQWILFAGIVMIACFMRFYRLTDLFYFTHDEEVVAFRVLRFILDKEPFLIGGVTPLHIHTTPYFYYLSAILLSLGRLSPLIWGIFGSFLGVITTILIYFVGKKMTSPLTGIIAAVFYGGSYLAALYDRHYWPLYFDPLLSLVAFYAIFLIIQRNFKGMYLLLFPLILGFSSDWSNLIYFLILAVVWVIFRFPLAKKEILISFLLFFLSFTPLVLFDIRHQFTNIGGISLFLTERKETLGWSASRFFDTFLVIPQVTARMIHVFGNKEVGSQYSYCLNHSLERLQSVPLLFTSLFFVMVGALYWCLRKATPTKEQIFIKLLLIFYGVTFLGINLYGNVFSSHVHDHYLATLFPIIALSVGYIAYRVLISSPRLKYFLISLVALFVVENIYSLLNTYTITGYSDKMEAVRFVISRVGEQDFELESIGNCFKYNGWRYLFFANGKEPVKSYVDKNYFWLYRKPTAKEHPEISVVMVTPDYVNDNSFFKRSSYGPDLLHYQKFGSIEVYIVDNKSHRYDGQF